ncbi:glycoside hydrolase family 32 protein [Cohnella candidum]|uniref:glycoside hydrolase family 32 protein n=1 Tax=Cohnella candidum TaxID=2674991 RepID=UPI001F14FDF3|nr:glycoside hydrolase family 32 protein [Cohnella candidum]
MLNTLTYDETYRPQFHYSPPAQWMNDPNGMVYYEGEYHLFYQHHPGSTVWGPMHWGHAVSKDLVRWEQHPIALRPDRNGTVFSGSAVVDWKDSSGFFGGGTGLVAIFTQDDSDPETGESRQRQSLAYSKDKGRTWAMFAGNPVLTDARFTDFRDPKVFWDERRGRWAMAIAAGDRIAFYTSPDLKEWTFRSEFGQTEGSHDGVWECPDLFELPVDGDERRRKWVLIVSIGDNPDEPAGSRTQYFVGSFDGDKFVNENDGDSVLWLDHGRDNYAAVTWSDVPGDDGRRLLIGWMSNWKYANQTPTDAWRGALTLPRVLELRSGAAGTRLVQKPVDDIVTLRESVRELRDVTVKEGENPLAGLEAECLEITAELELRGAEELGFRVRKSGAEETVVGYDASTGRVFVDRSRSGQSDFHEGFACRHEADITVRDGRLRLQLFVDRSSVEVFAGEGELAMTDLIFPSAGSMGLEFYAKGGEIGIVSMSVSVIKSIWQEAR